MKHRLFVAEELAYADNQTDPSRSLAARFAAREAAMKCLGVGLGAFGFHDVWVSRADSGKPSLQVTGTAAVLAERVGVRHWHVSLTHTDLVAIAYVLAE